MQDNYVVQWGDATEKKALPEGLVTVPETEYVVSRADAAGWSAARAMRTSAPIIPDPYASSQALWGWPVGRGKDGELWPVHCYGMVGAGRNMSPDTGSGARSEERRVGKECGSTGRSRWSPDHLKKH